MNLNCNKTAVITGVGGQDGMYLTHYLLGLGYKVVGVLRRTSTPNDTRLRFLKGSPNLHLVHGDVTDLSSIQRIVREFKPDEFYNLAAQSHVALSWEYPTATSEITGLGVLNCLEAIRKEKPDCRFYQAGSSEQFGNAIQTKYDDPSAAEKMGPSDANSFIKLNEDSPMHPESPYAVAKVFGYDMTRCYRRSFGIFASSGLLFNHESPMRGEEFVTRKITIGLSRVHWGLQEKVELGNMAACRDWGHARDYVRAMHAILQHNEPDDFVVATGSTHSVQKFFDQCCAYFTLDPKDVYQLNPKFFRPKDVNTLIGDASKARELLGWQPECQFHELVNKMCQYDYYSQSPNDKKRADEFIF